MIFYPTVTAMFDALIQDIVFDEDILYGLHPIQGCYIGIEYEKTTKFDTRNSKAQVKPRSVFSKYSASRYGNNHLLYQNRNGLLGFESKITSEQFLMDPRDIALSRSLIEEEEPDIVDKIRKDLFRNPPG